MERDPFYDRLRAAAEGCQPALTIELAKLYLAQNPLDVPSLIRYGMALQSVARYAEAEAVLGHALTAASDDGRALVYRQLGLLEEDRSDLAAAETAFSRAIEARPSDATGHVYLGGLLAKAGRLAEAEQVHRRGITCTEGCVDEAHFNLGLVLRAQERYLEALECFRTALALDPEYTAAQAALVDVEQVLFYFPEA